MPSYLGVDWAGSCWVVVRAGPDPIVTTVPSILNVWHDYGCDEDVQSILIDIPIGLPDSGVRACDQEAKALLANRASTVFSIPPREVVETDDYEEARELNDGSLGSQTWWLFPRIREVDVFLQTHPDAVAKIYESHPEVCFAILAGDALPPKDTHEGREARLNVLADNPPLHDLVSTTIAERADGAEWHDRLSASKRDDVIDAAVLAYTAAAVDLAARDSDPSYPRLPDHPDYRQIDPELSIPVEIIHSGFNR